MMFLVPLTSVFLFGVYLTGFRETLIITGIGLLGIGYIALAMHLSFLEIDPKDKISEMEQEIAKITAEIDQLKKDINRIDSCKDEAKAKKKKK